ncbi:hypothetical protein EK904_012462 [Melospiza melodia maxima]|nr:hypothetical protein EK904_012462 [Melospiza melodia maxima]
MHFTVLCPIGILHQFISHPVELTVDSMSHFFCWFCHFLWSVCEILPGTIGFFPYGSPVLLQFFTPYSVKSCVVEKQRTELKAEMKKSHQRIPALEQCTEVYFCLSISLCRSTSSFCLAWRHWLCVWVNLQKQWSCWQLSALIFKMCPTIINVEAQVSLSTFSSRFPSSLVEHCSAPQAALASFLPAEHFQLKVV